MFRWRYVRYLIFFLKYLRPSGRLRTATPFDFLCLSGDDGPQIEKVPAKQQLSSHNRRIMFRTAIVATPLAAATAISLTPDNWDSETAGKTVFIKFQAPW